MMENFKELQETFNEKPIDKTHYKDIPTILRQRKCKCSGENKIRYIVEGVIYDFCRNCIGEI